MLIYGGDLRKDGFTEFLFEEAQILQARLISENIYIENYVSWPIYLKDTPEIINWKARYKSVAEMREVGYPDCMQRTSSDTRSGFRRTSITVFTGHP